MKQLLLLFAGSLLLASCSSYRMHNPISIFTATNLDSSQRENSRINLAEYEKKYGAYDGVFLRSEQVLEHSGSGLYWTLSSQRKLKFLVLNPDAEWLTTFRVETDPTENLGAAYIRVFSPEGEVRLFTKNDLKVESSSDRSRVYKFAYPDIKKGSIVEEGYEITDAAATPFGSQKITLQNNMPCEHVRFRYSYPDRWQLQFKEIAPGKVIPYQVERDSENDLVTVSYEARDVPAIPDEPFSPYFKEIGSYMEFQIRSMQPRPDPDEVLTWGWMLDNYKSTAVGLYASSQVEETVARLTASCTSDYQKLDTIITYIQKNIKVGAGERGDDFEDILKKKQGNWYKLCGLARVMLSKAGLQSPAFLLIHSARDGYFDRNFVNHEQLTIPAVTVAIDGVSYVVFPYIENYPVNYIPDYIQGQTAISIGGEGKFAGFADISVGAATDNVIEETYNLSIGDDGIIIVGEEKKLTGATAYETRQTLSELNADEQEKAVRELLTYSDGDIKLTSYELIDLADYKKPLGIKLAYSIDNLVTVTPDEIIFQTGGLFSPSSNQKTKVDTEERQNPIRIYSAERFIKNVTIRHPASWTLNSTLKDLQLENVFGRASATYQSSPGMIKVSQERAMKQTSQPREKIDELLRVTGRKSGLYIPTLIFKVNG